MYDYKKNIKVITTPSGDKVIVTNDAIYTEILVALKDSERYHRDHNREATANSIDKLWLYLNDDETLSDIKEENE